MIRIKTKKVEVELVFKPKWDLKWIKIGNTKTLNIAGYIPGVRLSRKQVKDRDRQWRAEQRRLSGRDGEC